MAGLVKLPVAGDVGFGNEGQKAAALHRRGAVVQPPAPGHGKAHKGEHMLSPGVGRHGLQGLPGLPAQKLLAEEVMAGIAREAQLWQGQHPDAQGLRPVHGLHTLPGIVPAVRHMYIQAGGSHLDKTILHGILLSLLRG